jgi:toxin CcdB
MSPFRYHDGRGAAKYLLDVQSLQLDHLATRVVVPLVPAGGRFTGLPDLNPILRVRGEPLVMMTTLLAAVPRRVLGPALGNLLDQADDIARAIGILLHGF